MHPSGAARSMGCSDTKRIVPRWQQAEAMPTVKSPSSNPLGVILIERIHNCSGGSDSNVSLARLSRFLPLLSHASFNHAVTCALIVFRAAMTDG